ncbi:MAG: sugar ABC transporter substrate-binding protein [Pseudomonadota bacterium]
MKFRAIQVGFLASAILAAPLVSEVAAEGSAAQTAVEAAKQYAGTEITIVWEAGLQSLDPLNFSGPKWKELTGIDVKVIEVPTAEMFTKILQEHRAGTGAYDALNVIPAWMSDLARAGALEPLDGYVDKFGYRDELQEIAPVYRDNQMKVGDTIYGFPDDGDVFLFYYRKDILEENGMNVPTTWEEFSETAQALTDKYAPDMYGAAFFRDAPYAQFMFQERFRTEGGKFFNDETMAATVNSDVGVKVFADMRAENAFMPPGVETWGFVENLAAFLAGDTAMTISWPPYGRWAAGYGTDQEALSWVPKSEIGGKVGYALPPGGHPQLAAGFSLGVSASSKNKEAAYLFIQWLNSKETSLERVQLPYALRDPFRDSHFASEEYKSRWGEAAEYLDALQQGAVSGLLDLSLIQTDKYEEALRQGISRLWAGEDPQAILDDVAAQWDAVTERVGVDKQKEAYLDWASKPNAYPQ